MRKTLLSSVTSLLLPFGAYGAQTGYGYQRKVDMAIGSEMLHDSSLHALRVRMPEPVEADELAIEQGLAVRELVVMDAGIAEADKTVLRRALKPGIDLVEINPAEAGLPQLMRALSRYKNLAAIHVVSHAEAGVLLLGNSRITSETIQQEIQAFAALQDAMSEGGDLLFYGCDLAANEAGEELLDIISNKTGMDVTASNNLTGNSILKGDWELEVKRGNIETELAFSEKALADFSGVLAPNGTFTFSNVNPIQLFEENPSFDFGDFITRITTTGGYEEVLEYGAGTSCASSNGLYVSGFQFGSNDSKFYIHADPTSDSFALTTLILRRSPGYAATSVNILGFSTYASTTASATLNNISIPVSGGTTVDLSSVSGFNNIQKIRIVPNDAAFCLDSITFAPASASSPNITSATYDASTGALVVTGTNFTATGGAANDVVANKFTLTAEGGSTYTLTNTPNTEISSATSFTLNLSTTDQAAVNQILNKNGTSSTGVTTYNLAGAAGFIAASSGTADAANGITVSNVAAPTITSATYNGTTGVLAVTGTGFLKLSGATNDIDVSKLSITGDSTPYALTTGSVEITNGTSFSITLSGTDQAALLSRINQDGATSEGAVTYNLAAAEDWAAGADAAVAVADLTGNGITASAVNVGGISSGCAAIQAYWSNGITLSNENEDWQEGYVVAAGEVITYQVTSSGSTNASNNQNSGAGFAIYANGGDATDVPETYAYLNNELNLNGSHTVPADEGNYVVYLWSGESDATTTATVTCGEAPPANTPPVISSLSGDSVDWAEVGNTFSLDSGGDASLSDTELGALNGGNGDWSGASLTVQRNGTAVPEDIFGFDTSGASFTVSGSNLQSGNQTFATFTNTNGVLTISFTSSGTTATTALVNDVVRHITYRNDTPAGDATIRFTLNDGTASTTADVTVTSDTVYVTNTSDDGTRDASNGVGLREALIIAVNNSINVEHIIFDGALAGQTITAGSTMIVYQTVSIDADAASGLTIAGGSIDLNPGTTVTLINGVADSLTISSAISESGSLVKSGTGTLTLSGTNTYSGSTTVSAGTLSVASDSNLGSGNVSLDSGTALAVTGTTTIDNTLALAGDATIDNSAALTLSGVVSGASNFTKSGAGTLTLSGTNTYSGSTTVSAGTLSIASDSNLGSDTLNLSGGGLSITGATTIDNSIGLTGSASVANTDTVTLSGVISGTGNLGKSGAGTLTLSATNTYAGTTSVGVGTLSIASDSNIGSGSLNLSDGSTLSVTGATTLDNAIALSGDAAINNSDSLTVSGVISGDFGITKTGAATLTLSGTNTYTGTTTVSAGALSVAGDSNLGADPLTLAAGTTLAITGAGTIDNAIALVGNAAINNSADATLSGVLSGGFELQKAGAGVLTLSGTNTQTGTVNVSAGLLHVIGSTSSATSVASGATLGGSGTLGGSVNIQNGGTLSPGSSPGTLTINGDLTMAAGSTLVVEIDGAVAGTGYDQLIVTGAVDVTDATLSVTHNYVPGNGDSYTIITNDAGDPITGTFDGLAESGTFAANGNSTVLTASYTGGTGNDFTLTSPINAAPVIGDLDADSRSFIQGTGPVLLDDPTDAATVTDADSTDFNNGTLVVSIVSGEVAGEDVLAINNQGTDTGQIGVSGTDVTYEGITIGSFTGGTAGDDLQITFNGNTDAVAAQALVRNLTYNNLNATNAISQANRTVRVTVSDGDGGTSSNADVTVAVVETVAPSVVSIVVADTNLVIGDTTTVTITFSEAVTNLQIADFTVANGALSNLTSADSGITWTATLTPSATTQDTDNLITLDNTAYTDLAGNPGTGTADSNNYAVDTLRPTATLVVTDTSLIAGETSLVTITFNEMVTGFTNADLAVANGTLEAVSSSDGGVTWTATFTPTAEVTDPTNLITLDNTGVTDTAGNAGSGTTDSNNYAIDTSRPIAAVVVVETQLLNGDTSTVTIIFSEAVSGLGIADFLVDNGSLSAPSSSDGGISWTATLTPTADVDDATNVITLDNTGVVDLAGNTGSGSTTSNNYAIDSTVPTVTSVGIPADDTYVAGQTLTFTVNTSEAITVDIGGGRPQLALTIGATSRVAEYDGGSGTTALTFSYTVQSGDLDGNGITVGALSSNGGTLRDAAGNNLTLALNVVDPTTGVLVDAVAPTLVSLSPLDEAVTVTPDANLVITLSEDITLATGNILVHDSNDAQVALIDVSDHGGQLAVVNEALTINLPADLVETESYYVQIASTAVTDLAGNAFAGISDPTAWNFTVADVTPPTVTSVEVSGSPPANAEAIQFTVTFNEVPANISVSDFTLSPSSSGVSGSIASHSPVNLNTVTVTIDQITGTGTLRLDVNANSGITDTLGNGNGTNGFVAAFTSGDLHTVDREAPAAPSTLDLAVGSDLGESDSDNITSDATPTFAGTAEADSTVSITSSMDGTLGTTTADGSGNWSFTPGAAISDGEHEITAVASDAAGNDGPASSALAVQIDTQAPGAALVLADTVLTIGETSLLTITFDEQVAGFANDDLTIPSGTLTPVASSDGGTTWTATYTPAADTTAATNVFSLVLTGVSDIAGNAGIGTADTANFTIDTAPPTATITVADDLLTFGETSLVTISFSEMVSGFANDDLTIENGALGTVSSGDGGITWTATFTPDADLDEPVNFIVLDNTGVQDASGNPGVGTTSSNSFAIRTLPITLTVNATLDSGDDATLGSTLEEDQLDGEGLSIREALAWAAPGDVITFDFDTSTTGNQGGTITLGGTELSITHGNILIDGDLDDDGSPDVTISGNNTSRVMMVNGSLSAIELTGLTLTQGATGTGGGALLIGSNSSVTVRDSNITDSVDSGAGGGGIYGSSATLTMINSTVSGNSSSTFGGGIRIVSDGGTLNLINSTVSGNTTTGTSAHGGGIQYGATGALTIVNSTISGNTTAGASSLGGGLRITSGTAFLYNTTVVGNASAGSGGGVSANGTDTFVNTVVAGNTSGAGAIAGAAGSPLATGGMADDMGGTVEVATNSFFGTTATITTNNDSLNNQGTSNLLLGDLANYNGSPIQTHRPLTGSALLEAGSNAALPADTYDLDGDSDTAEPLPVDTNGDQRVSGTVDIGAVEGNAAPTLSNVNGGNTFVENGSAIVIDNDIIVSDVDLDLLNGGNGDYSGASAVFVRNGGAVASDSFGFNDGSGISLSGGSLLKNGQIIASFDTSTAGQLTITFTNANGEIPEQTDVSVILQQVTYSSSSEDPGSNANIDVTLHDGADASVTEMAAVVITEINDAPTITATGGTHTFTENDPALTVFSNAAASTVEAGQTITGLTLSVTNLADGTSELLSIDGTDITLTNGASGTTVDNAVSYSVSVSGSTASLTLVKAGGLAIADVQTLVNGITYANPSEAPTDGNRVVTITSITDDGGTANGGFDTAMAAVPATATVVAVNDAPTDIGLSATTLLQSATGAGAVAATLSSVDLDDTSFTYSLVAAATAISGSCAGDSGNASFQIADNTLQTAATLAGGSFAICLQTSDGEASYKKGFTVTVTDDVAPMVTGVAVPADDYYTEGDVLTFTVSTSEAVSITGAPRLPIILGAGTRYAEYASGSGSSALTFTYTVQAGDLDSDGIQLAATLETNGGTLQDGANNPLALTLNGVASTAGVLVDAVVPTLISSIPVDNATTVTYNTTVTLTFSEPVLAGSGNLTLYDAADDSVVEAFAVGGVTINNNVVTLDPATDLVPNHSYYLQIDDTALLDAAGNAYAGIADTTTLNFTVSNTAPVANADMATVAEDVSVDVVVLTNDTDADSSINAASVTVVTGPANGSTSVNTANGVITYTPSANFNGTDTFTYTVEDVFSALSNESTVSVTVTPVNDAPVAVADIVNTPEDNPVSIDVAANDTDIDTGDSVDPDSIVIVSAPTYGTASVVNGEVLYTPHLDYNGSDSFTYTIDDQNGATSNVATAIINITGVNDLPDAADDTATVAEDDEVDIDVLANDSDVEGSLDTASVQVLSNPTNGTVGVDALTGVITYIPSANFHGTDAFTYVVQDDDGGTSNEATVTVTVTSVNDAPVTNADTAVLLEDTAHTINVLGNDTDIDGTLVLASVQVVTAAEEGSTSINAITGAIVYTPNENFNGSDSFTYRVQDNEGAWSNAALVTITVEDVNDEPLANNDTAITDEDTAVTIDLLGNDSDVDGALDPFSLTLTQPANGVVTDHEDGTVTYDPDANFFGTDSFSYSVMDDDGGVSNSATVTITVNPVNDAPVINGDPVVTVAQDATYSFTPVAADVDPNTTLIFSITNQPEWASFNATTGVLTGTPGNDHVGDYDGIVITVSDGLLSASLPAFSIEVTNVNDAPEISGTPVGTVNQDGSYSFVPNAVDVDPNTTLIFSVQNLPHWATFNPSTGAITGTPANSDVGTYNNIVISVNDGITTTTLDGFDITVANVNDPPMIVADSYQLDEGALLLRNTETGVLANDSDIDGDNLIAVLVASPRNAAEFSFNENGGFRYQHNGSETRTDSFTYRISDGTASSAPATVNLAINPVNDAPVFVTQPPLAVTEGALYRYEVGVVDPDSTVTLSLQEGAPEWLTLSGFSLSGTAPINELETAQVVLRATDDGGYTVDQTYDLTVLEQEASLVTVTTSWQGLPSIVGNTVDLRIVLTHATGPAVSGATLQVSRQGLTSVATMANCTNAQQVFNCPVSLAAGASTSFRLRLTPEEAGNLVVQIQLRSASEQIAAAITDVSVTERAVSQGNVTFNLANATALASINLLNDGTRELVAGTNLGNTVKLLNYTLASGSAEVLSEIDNRGYTERVRVADIDQDGLEDIVVVNRSGEASAVYYDRGDEFVKEAGEVLPHAREALVRDLNDDGYPELILGASGFNLYIYENNEGVYDIPPLVFTSPASIVHFALLRRVPMDAPLEGTLVISSATAVQLVRFGLNPDGGPAKPDENDVEGAALTVSEKFTVVQELPISGVSSLQLVDVDGDGREEIIASTTHQNNSAEASGVTVIGVAADDQLQTIARLGAASAQKVEVADFNGDGVADLLVANDNKSYQFYRGTGNPADWTLTNTILYHSSTLVIPEDVNGDGLADVLVYEDGDEQVELYLSAPDGDTGESADLTLSAATRVVRNDRYHFEYAVTVTNEGESMAEQPRVTVPLPNGVDVVSLPEYCMEDAEVSEVICNLQDLQPGAGQVIPLILAGDWRINDLSLTVQATSDALENDMANNITTTSLSGMFEYKRARIKGGGGSVNFLWFGALMGLALARRRKHVFSHKSSIRKIPSLILPLAASMAVLDTATVEAANLEANSYIEGSVGTISSDWDMMTFYYDLAGSTQEAVLVEKDDQRFGWQLVYGYRFRPWIALELGYLDSGQTELEVDTVISETEPLRQVLIDHAPVAGDGPYAGLRLSLVSRDQREIYAKLGVWSWSAGYTLTLGDQTEWIKRSDEDWLVGLGFSQSIMERLSLGGNIQTTAMGDNRLIFVGLNLGYKFDVGR